MCRCSQPLAGFSARCMEDEQMLQDILLANKDSNFMYVVDTRPRVSPNACTERLLNMGINDIDVGKRSFHAVKKRKIGVNGSKLVLKWLSNNGFMYLPK